MGLYAHLTAASARIIGVLTIIAAIGAAGAWGIIPALFIGLAGVVLLTRNAHNSHGIRNILAGVTWWALITIGIATSPAVA